jgi:hypothetical protein
VGYDALIGFCSTKIEVAMISNNLAQARKSACLLVALGFTVASIPAGAAIVTPSASVTVTQSYAYTAYECGDFVFSTSGTAPGCGNGWWIAASDPGFKSAVAAVLAAQIAGSFIIVYGNNGDMWSGSPSGQYCRAQTVGLTS